MLPRGGGDSERIKIEGGRERREEKGGGGGGEKEHLPFISIAYFANSKLDDDTQHDTYFICLYSIYLSRLNMICKQFEIHSLKYFGSVVGALCTLLQLSKS
jgi:hypothetical protein